MKGHLEENGIRVDFDEDQDRVWLVVNGEYSKQLDRQVFIQTMYRMINTLENFDQK